MIRSLHRVAVSRVTVRPGRRVLAILVVALGALMLTGAAFATEFGANSLTFGSCCGGATLDGSRADVTVSRITPDSTQCIAFSSVITSNDSNRQLQAAKARCGVNANIDGTCSLSNNFVKLVERIPAVGSPVCFPHGAASLNTSDRLTVWNSAGNGTYFAYIDGVQYEGQSGYDNINGIEEFAEYTGTVCNTSWTGQANFVTWQRYYVAAGAWTTVQSSNQLAQCWSVGLVSNGNFSVGH
jgi:hypothetical protein